jgi:cysteine desulfurase
MKQIYLDYAAATPVDKAVLTSMQSYYSDNFYNPSATYLSAQAVRNDIKAARETAARSIGARYSEIVFTAGGTEANNLAVSGMMQNFTDKHLVVSAIEHDSVLEVAKKFNHTTVPVSQDGRIDIDKLRSSILDDTVLVSCIYVNNEIGTVQSLREMSSIISDIRESRDKAGSTTPLYLHTDACQAANYLSIQVGKLGVDLMTLNGGKMYGPKQSGMLYVRTGVKLQPIIYGGGQEWKIRSGTENVAGIIGFSKALQRAVSRQSGSVKQASELQAHFIDTLTSIIPSVVINGSLKYRVPNNVHVTFSGVDNERLMMELDERGIMCAVGSACSASSDEPSHVLKAIGLSDEQAQSSLRFTFGKHTTKDDLDYVVSSLSKLLNKSPL